MRASAYFGMISALALATVASAAEAPGPKSPWEGFGVGSWVHLKTTTKTRGPGLSMPDETTETRETLAKVTAEAHTTKRETKTTTGWEVVGESVHARRVEESPPGVETEDLGTEKLVVEGKAIECKKVRTKFARTIITTWTSRTYGVLKTESDNDAGGGKTYALRTVTALAKKVKIAGKELVCRETTLFTRMELPGMPARAPGEGTNGVELESDAVPGRRVRFEATSKGGPLSRSEVEELVAFEVKPP